MNRADLIEVVSGQVGVSKVVTDRLLCSVMDAIQAAVTSGEAVTLEGFGIFKAGRSAAHKVADPQTGEPVATAAGPRFYADPAFTAAVAAVDSDLVLEGAGDSLDGQGDALQHNDQIAQALSVVSAGFPRLAKEIGSFWGFPECRDYLDRIAVNGWDARSRESIGFDTEVRSAIRTLQSIHPVSA